MTMRGSHPCSFGGPPLLPHTPHNPPEKFLKLFDPQTIPIPHYIKEQDRAEFIRKERLSLAMEAWTDEEIGKLRAKLKEKGEDENTLYVFLIDNGWSNGLPAKGSVFEKGLSTPAFFTWPGHIPDGLQREDLMSSLDIYPTLLNYAGVKLPDAAAGLDLREHLEQQSPLNPKETVWRGLPHRRHQRGQVSRAGRIRPLRENKKVEVRLLHSRLTG